MPLSRSGRALTRAVVSALHVHLVFVAKYRRGRLTSRVRALLAQSFASVCLDFGAFLEACDGEEDHVHLLVAYPPGVAVATLVNSLKGVSSRYVRASRFAEVRSRSADAFWSPSSFAASCGGAALRGSSVGREPAQAESARRRGRHPGLKGRGLSR